METADVVNEEMESFTELARRCGSNCNKEQLSDLRDRLAGVSIETKDAARSLGKALALLSYPKAAELLRGKWPDLGREARNVLLRGDWRGGDGKPKEVARADLTLAAELVDLDAEAVRHLIGEGVKAAARPSRKNDGVPPGLVKAWLNKRGDKKSPRWPIDALSWRHMSSEDAGPFLFALVEAAHAPLRKKGKKPAAASHECAERLTERLDKMRGPAPDEAARRALDRALRRRDPARPEAPAPRADSEAVATSARKPIAERSAPPPVQQTEAAQRQAAAEIGGTIDRISTQMGELATQFRALHSIDPPDRLSVAQLRRQLSETESLLRERETEYARLRREMEAAKSDRERAWGESRGARRDAEEAQRQVRGLKGERQRLEQRLEDAERAASDLRRELSAENDRHIRALPNVKEDARSVLAHQIGDGLKPEIANLRQVLARRKDEDKDVRFLAGGIEQLLHILRSFGVNVS